MWPRYPFIPLRKALERAKAIRDAAGANSVISANAIELWGYSAKASGGVQTVAALKYYGLIQSIGPREARKLKLTEDARKYLLDERPDRHAEAHKIFALRPRAMSLIWELWHDKPPRENIARSTLKIDYSYSENSAREVLAIYLDNLAFAGLSGSDKIDPVSEGVGSETDEENESTLPEVSRRTVPMLQPQPIASAAPLAQPTAYLTQGTREDNFNLPEGVVTLSFPEHFSADSYEDLKAWLEFQQNRLKRWVREQ